MNLIDLQKLKPKADNVLVRLSIHERETVSAGGIVLPTIGKRGHTEAVEATVVSAGPGHFYSIWHGLEKEPSTDGSTTFIAMNPDLRPGAKVLIDGPHCGDVIYSNEGEEYRMVREMNIVGIVDEEEAGAAE